MLSVRIVALALAGLLAAGCVVISPHAGATSVPVSVSPSPDLPSLSPATPSPEPVSTPTPSPTPTPLPTATPTAVPATPAFDPTSEEALLASMLAAEDVDPTAVTDGVDVGTTVDDLPAFAENGGLRRAAQTFDADDGMTVFDFRYQFATEDDAIAFLDAEEENLGEIDFGAQRIDPPPVLLGDDTRYYYAHTAIFLVQDSFNYLIRVGNVVAKVWIGGDPEFVTADRAALIAITAGVRMDAVFKGELP